jgi:hypothetical protein
MQASHFQSFHPLILQLPNSKAKYTINKNNGEIIIEEEREMYTIFEMINSALN